MKNFDLEAAKRGAAVCTRDGKQARIVCLDADNPLFIIIALVRDTSSGKVTPQSYRDDGGWLPVNIECNEDLMMRDDDYLEKLERGEYDHIADARKMVGPAIKQNLTTDREYWRYEFAGRAMSAQIAGVLINGAVNRTGKSPPDIITEDAVLFADALIEELDKTEKK